MWTGVQALCSVALARGLDGDPARWTRDAVAGLLTHPTSTSTVENGQEPPFAALVIMGSMHLFLSFLSDTGRWRGTQMELAAIRAQLEVALAQSTRTS